VTKGPLMATATARVQPGVSGLIRLGYASAVTPAQPQAPEEPRQAFARIVREAREQRGWGQDQLAEAAGVSRPTIQRWETAKTGTPDPENARRVFQALGLDPRLIPVVLGYVTAEEMGVDPVPPRLRDATTEEILTILEDPKVSVAQKREWLEFLRFRTGTATVTGRGSVSAEGIVIGPAEPRRAG
jgi:transcriptional regulator with XRE-family HTH domain